MLLSDKESRHITFVSDSTWEHFIGYLVKKSVSLKACLLSKYFQSQFTTDNFKLPYIPPCSILIQAFRVLFSRQL